MGGLICKPKRLTPTDDMDNIEDGWFEYVDYDNPQNSIPRYHNCLGFQQTLNHRGFKIQFVFCENNGYVSARLRQNEVWKPWKDLFNIAL